MTTTEDLLRRSLHARAERTTYEPTRAVDVATRARFLQRRRRRTTGLAAAAAVALIVPTGLILGDGADSSPEPAGPTSPRVVRVDELASLRQGAPPAIDHVEDRTYVFASGERVDLPVQDGAVLDAAPYQGGVLVAGADLGTGTMTPELTLLGRDGTIRWTRCGSDAIEVSADRGTTAFGWTEGDCARWATPRVEHGPSEADGPAVGGVLAAGQRIDPVGVTADQVVVNIVEPSTGTSLRVEVISGEGSPEPVPGLVQAQAYDGSGLVAGCPADGRCAVVDVVGGSPTVTFAENEVPLTFSPDGRLIATAVYAEGEPAALTVREVSTGDAVATLAGAVGELRVDPRVIAWEDPAHLLVGRIDSGGEALVRLGTDGSVELATPVRAPTLGGFLLPDS